MDEAHKRRVIESQKNGVKYRPEYWIILPPDDTKIRCVQQNPKAVTSASHRRYERYKSAKTFSEYYELGGKKGDAKFDLARGYIEILTEGVKITYKVALEKRFKSKPATREMATEEEVKHDKETKKKKSRDDEEDDFLQSVSNNTHKSDVDGDGEDSTIDNDKERKSLSSQRVITAEEKKRIGSRVKKLFDGVPFEGTVMSIDYEGKTGQVLYHIRYDDGDEEDVSATELKYISIGNDEEEKKKKETMSPLQQLLTLVFSKCLGDRDLWDTITEKFSCIKYKKGSDEYELYQCLGFGNTRSSMKTLQHEWKEHGQFLQDLLNRIIEVFELESEKERLAGKGITATYFRGFQVDDLDLLASHLKDGTTRELGELNSSGMRTNPFTAVGKAFWAAKDFFMTCKKRKRDQKHEKGKSAKLCWFFVAFDCADAFTAHWGNFYAKVKKIKKMFETDPDSKYHRDILYGFFTYMTHTTCVHHVCHVCDERFLDLQCKMLGIPKGDPRHYSYAKDKFVQEFFTWYNATVAESNAKLAVWRKAVRSYI
eukprot:g6639.t1